MMMRPVFAPGWIVAVPAHSFSEPVRPWVTAAERFIPSV